MRKMSLLSLTTALCLAPCLPPHAEAQTKTTPPLSLTHRYELQASIKGHFDHFAVDPQGKRLFGTAVEDKILVVFDLTQGKMTHAISGIEEPRGVVYRSDLRRLYVSDGGGALRIFDSNTFKPLKMLKLLVDADPVAYDPATKRLFVVNGGEKAKHTYSDITVFDTTTEAQVGDIHVQGIEIEGMAVEKAGPRLFANNRDKNEIDVFDRIKLTRLATWPVTSKKNTVMAFDEATHRMFVACHEGQLVVMDLNTGKELQALPIGGGADDISFDPATKRIYVSGGAGNGSIDVYEEKDADHYQSLGRITSAPGAATGRLIPELGEYVTFVPAQKNQRAEVLVFAVK